MYGKIFESIFDSTLIENQKATYVFMAMVVLSDQEGILNITKPALARRINISLDELSEAIEYLLSPDTESNSKEFEGRRLIKIDESKSWGWQVVNKQTYAKISRREEKREKDKIRMREKRSEKKNTNNSDLVAKSRKPSQPVADVAYTDTDTDTDTDVDTKKNNILSKNLYDEKFEYFWCRYPKKIGKKNAAKVWSKIDPDDVLYEQILVAVETAKKSKQWLSNGGQFIPHPTTWLNRDGWLDDYEQEPFFEGIDRYKNVIM